MAFGAFNPQRNAAMMADINVTPMVDVMLVLLVIFIITAPMFTHAVKLDLPHTAAAAGMQPGAPVTVAINARGQIFWNDEAVDAAGLDKHLTALARQPGQPELQLRADKETRYETVAQVMAAAQALGVQRLGFVTEPKKDAAHGQR